MEKKILLLFIYYFNFGFSLYSVPFEYQRLYHPSDHRCVDLIFDVHIEPKKYPSPTEERIISNIEKLNEISPHKIEVLFEMFPHKVRMLKILNQDEWGYELFFTRLQRVYRKLIEEIRPQKQVKISASDIRWVEDFQYALGAWFSPLTFGEQAKEKRKKYTEKLSFNDVLKLEEVILDRINKNIADRGIPLDEFTKLLTKLHGGQEGLLSSVINFLKPLFEDFEKTIKEKSESIIKERLSESTTKERLSKLISEEKKKLNEDFFLALPTSVGKKLREKHETAEEAAQTFIRGVDVATLDAYFICCIRYSKIIKHFIIYAGGAHCRAVSNQLQEEGFKVVHSIEGTEKIVPLSEHDVNDAQKHKEVSSKNFDILLLDPLRDYLWTQRHYFQSSLMNLKRYAARAASALGYIPSSIKSAFISLKNRFNAFRVSSQELKQQEVMNFIDIKYRELMNTVRILKMSVQFKFIGQMESLINNWAQVERSKKGKTIEAAMSELKALMAQLYTIVNAALMQVQEQDKVKKIIERLNKLTSNTTAQEVIEYIKMNNYTDVATVS